MEARSTAFYKQLSVELPVSTARLHSRWAPITELHAKSVRVMLPDRFIPVVEAFLEYKKHVGDKASKQFFAQFNTIADYVPRLIEKRPVAFYGKSWTTRLRNGTIVDDAHEAYKNGGSPVSLAEYITLEEAQIAALLVVSSPAIWADAAGAKPVHGIAVGITPPKLDEPDLFDALHAIVQDTGSKAGRGYASAHIELGEDKSIDGYYLDSGRVEAPSHWQHVWAGAYYSAMKREELAGKPSGSMCLYFVDDPSADPEWLEPLADGKTYLNRGVFERRIRFAVEAFFLDCVTRSQATNKPACAILESRVFVAPDDPDRKKKEKYVIDAIITTLNAGVFKDISTLQLINFTASACERWYNQATLDDPTLAMVFAPEIKFISNDGKEIGQWQAFFSKSIIDKAHFQEKYFSFVVALDASNTIWEVPNGMLPCMAYACDVNALPGNMLWAGMAQTTFPRATITEVQNPHINADPTLRALLTPFIPPINETTIAKLYVIGDRYYREMNDVERGGQPDSVARGYGELDKESVERVLSSLDNIRHPDLFREGTVLYDIGSGQGIFALHAYFFLCEGKKAGVAGIEFYQSRVDVSNKVKRLMAHHRAGTDDLPNVRFFQGDATTKDLPENTTVAYSFDLLQGPNIDVGSSFDRNTAAVMIDLGGPDGMYAIKDLSDAYTATRKRWTSRIEEKLAACATCTRFVSALPPRITVTKTVRGGAGKQTWSINLYAPERLKFLQRIENLKLSGDEAVALYVYAVVH